MDVPAGSSMFVNLSFIVRLLSILSQRVRTANFRQLVSTLEQVKREHSDWIARRIAEETKALTSEKAAFHALKLRAAAEAKEATALAKLRYTVACATLSSPSVLHTLLRFGSGCGVCVAVFDFRARSSHKTSTSTRLITAS